MSQESPNRSSAGAASEPASESASPVKDKTSLLEGYSLEEGVLARVREWTDVFPWIRLVRVLRLAGSPTAFVMVAATMLVWVVGMQWLEMSDPLGHAMQSRSDGIPSVLVPVFVPIANFIAAVAEVARWHNPAGLLVERRSLGTAVLAHLWTIVLWTTPVLFLLRQGSLLTAGRDMASAGGTFRLARRRTTTAFIAIVMPVLCVIPFLVTAMLLGWLDRVAGMTPSMGSVLAILASLVLLPLGALAAGSYVAIPIGLAAIVNERQPDALDGLSRGYEVLLRRPLHLMGNVLVGAVAVIAIGCLVTWVTDWAGLVAERWVPMHQSARGTLAPGSVGASASIVALKLTPMAQTLRVCLRFFPCCVVFALSWGMIGGVYLLMRQSTGGQEVEDIWVDPVKPPEPLPDLPS